jgi:dCTP deaminase
MILTSETIHEEVLRERIIIEPYNRKYLNPNSYNFHLGDKLFIYTNDVIDPKIEQPIEQIEIPDSGFILSPGQLYLGHTQEVMGSDYYVPFIFGRSSIGRLGLFVQITAPLGDIGFVGRWTLQLTPTLPIRVYKKLRIGQIFFIKPFGEIRLYEGKYQNSIEARKSEIFRDF